jgi:hypothetical protein
LSINAARNCLAHREGIVHEKDTEDGMKLVVRWTATHVFIQFDDGAEEELQLGVPLRANGTVCLRTGVAREKTYSLGEKVSVSAKEFIQIGWSLYADAVAIAKLVETKGIAGGHLKPPAPPTQ